jgi:hypothetical protein
MVIKRLGGQCALGSSGIKRLAARGQTSNNELL